MAGIYSIVLTAASSAWECLQEESNRIPPYGAFFFVNLRKDPPIQALLNRVIHQIRSFPKQNFIIQMRFHCPFLLFRRMLLSTTLWTAANLHQKTRDTPGRSRYRRIRSSAQSHIATVWWAAISSLILTFLKLAHRYGHHEKKQKNRKVFIDKGVRLW